MRRLVLALASMSATIGCRPPEPPPAPQAVEQGLPAEPRADLPDEQRSSDLFGAWVVETVGSSGEAASASGWDQVLLVGSRQLEIISQCVTIGPFGYGRTVGGGIAVGQSEVQPAPRGAPGLPAPVKCARTLTPAERELGPLLLAAREVTPTGNGTITLSGPRGSLTARRPSGALNNPRGEAPPPSVPPLLGAWQFVSIEGRPLPSAARMEMLLTPNRIEWRSGCVNEARELRRGRDVLLPGKVDPFPVCERGRSPSERAAERLFAGSIAARMSRDGSLTVQGSGVVAELAPLTR